MTHADLGIAAMLDGFRDLSLSPVEVWDAVEARISAWEPRLNALCHYDPAAARRAAHDSAARWRAGRPMGALDGVPVTLKELIATEGVPIPQGTTVFDPAPAERDAPPAARLRAAGAVLFAKTTVPDLAMLSSGLSSRYGITRNPWRLDRNPGGSSAGAAAAAAAGYGPLHIGTDIGGSVRLPAGWCGLVGFKPSLGRVPIEPYYVGRAAGPITRTVADAALAMTVLAAPDRRDAMSLAPEAIDWLDVSADLAQCRIGLMLDAGCGLALDPEIATIIEAAAGRFAALGARIAPAAPVMTPAMLEGIDQFWRCRAWAELRGLPPDRLARLLPYVLDWARAAEAIPGWRAVEAFNETMAMRAATAAAFAEFDLVISPTAPVAAFEAHLPSPQNDPTRPFDHIVYTLPWNMGEQPCLSINAGFTADGLPVGLQIVGPRFADRLVLAAAAAFERVRGPMPVWPREDALRFNQLP